MNLYEKTYVITANEIDNNYCLSSSGILLFLQDSIASFMATWHAAAFDISGDGLIWVVLEYMIEITGDVPVWSNSVKVSLSVSEITSMRTFFDFKMSDSNGKNFSEGTSVWALIDSRTRQPYIESLEYVTKKSGIFLDRPIVKHSRNRFPQTVNLISRSRYETQITDIDFNGHVCNRTYLSVALACVENNRAIKDFSIKYVKETYLGDILHVECSCVDSEVLDTSVCKITNSENDIVCLLKFSFMKDATIQEVKNLVART